MSDDKRPDDKPGQRSRTFEDEKNMEQTRSDGGNSNDQNPEPRETVREENRENERGFAQRLYDGLTNAGEGVSNAVTAEHQETAQTAERTAEAEEAMHDAQEDMVGRFQELGADAAREKTRIEGYTTQRDDELHNPEERNEAQGNYEAAREGGMIDSEFSFGLYESLVNTEFLSDDVVKMRYVEDNSYTHGDRGGRSLPFIEEAEIADSDARGWASRFNSDLDAAIEKLGEHVDLFNLGERKDAYENAVDRYEQTGEFEDRIEEIEEEAEKRGLEGVNELIDSDYEALEGGHLEELQDTIAEVGGHMNGREDGTGSVNLEHPERENAEELVRQTRARALDAAALHKDRLDEAREELGAVQTEIRQTRDEVQSYVDDVEDLTALNGVGDAFADVLGDMGIDTVMDLAARNDFDSNPAYQEQKRTENGVAVPDANALRENAFDYLNEVASDKENLDFVPTDTIRDVGDNYSDEDQRRRHHEAVYDSANSLVNVMNELEGEIPDLDQYDVDWDGDADTLEDERQEVYSNLDVDYPVDAENALNPSDVYAEE
ncbi:MAG: hypothetical protein BRC29_01090 [Nanohaloarchaea archaeon SW_7_43_1]|nr:MAG: hypothetical protein BRC29_01090 [Nanohaloarchaea archaeon SW_7_43_1]